MCIPVPYVNGMCMEIKSQMIKMNFYLTNWHDGMVLDEKLVSTKYIYSINFWLNLVVNQVCDKTEILTMKVELD